MVGIEDDAVAVKVLLVVPDATVTAAGTVSSALLLASETVEPPEGAACESVTVQVLWPLCPRLAGVHETVETSTGAVRLIEAV